jgi:hypothetical protein
MALIPDVSGLIARETEAAGCSVKHDDFHSHKIESYGTSFNTVTQCAVLKLVQISYSVHQERKPQTVNPRINGTLTRRNSNG